MSDPSDRGAAERARRHLEEAERRLGRLPVSRLRDKVRDVVVIACSSRGGSSVLAEMLRRTPQLLHFRAEVNPFFVLSGLSFPHSATGSDALEAAHADSPAASILEARLAADLGVASDDADVLRAFPDDVACRLVLQWPWLSLDVEQVSTMARDLMVEVDPRRDVQRYHVTLLERLRQRHPAINAWFYDVAPALVAELCPQLHPADGPPGDVIIEEPPFVAVRPWRLATSEELAQRPVIIKTPSNAYRLSFLRAFFPRARFRVLHLRRNPAASINGLVDGWLYRGFFAHPLPLSLHIAGYTDVCGAWARHWWKYDLPPGWEAYTHRPLVEVCAFQWMAAHRAILDFLDGAPEVEAMPLYFEDVVGSAARRRVAFEALTAWLGIELDAPLEEVVCDSVPPVMATTAPRQRRWFEKAALLDRVLSWPQIKQTVERLSYDNDPAGWT